MILEQYRALDLGVNPEYLDSECPQAPSHSPEVFTALICNDSYLGKSRSANVLSYCKLIATNLNVHLICVGAVSNGYSSEPINRTSLCSFS